MIENQELSRQNVNSVSEEYPTESEVKIDGDVSLKKKIHSTVDINSNKVSSDSKTQEESSLSSPHFLIHSIQWEQDSSI